MRRLLLAVPLAGLLVLARGADAPPAFPTAFECRWAGTPITLDGTADEPAWAAAQTIDSFHLPWLGDKARKAAAGTRAKLLWDREYIYFFADMDDADLLAKVTEHDGNTWTDDVFELFFRPAADKPGYYEFQVNAAGTVFDAFFPKRGVGDVRKADTFHVEQKVRLRGTLNKSDDTDRGWSVEGRIPWSDFRRAGGRPEPGEGWRFALCRYDHAAGRPPELSTVAPLRSSAKPNFHLIDEYATLKFVGPPAGEKPPPVTTSTVVGSPEPPPPYRPRRMYPRYRPSFPIHVTAIPGTDQMFVLTQPAPYTQSTLWRVPDRDDVTDADAVKVMDTPEPGVAYDIAFHPRFAENGYLYLGWNGQPPGGKSHSTRVTRFTMDRTPPYTLDPKSGVTVIEWESNGHNGGAVCFGTDGMLYVTSGDGTSDSDRNLMGQRTDTLLAKVLRIDVDHPAPGKMYAVPTDNPFVGDRRFAPETWAYGLRNPWRIASDPKTGHVWVGNNGQDLWETAHLVRPGENYGWSVTEGSHPFYPGRTAGPTPIAGPTIEHHHSLFRSLTGGLVYHGDRLPGLRGAYLYGDYSTGRIWGMRHDGTRPEWHRELAVTPMRITGFGRNTRGELLVCDHAAAGQGGFYTLDPTPPAGPSTFPRKLSESGLFASVKDHRMVPGVIPYAVTAPFWSDGLHKERWLALPPGGTIGYRPTGGWEFPDRTVIVKSFAAERTDGDPASRYWVETRFLTRQGGEWYGYSYRWNDAGTDAELVPAAGADRELVSSTGSGTRRQPWHYPSRAECMVCHSRAANYVLGLSEVQANRPCPDAPAENQLARLERLGLLRSPSSGGDADPDQRSAAKESALLPEPPSALKALADPDDAKTDVGLRARSWLHANCSMCHVEAGGGNARIDLDFLTPADKSHTVGERPQHHTFGLADARVIAPGAPDRSVLLRRVGVRGPGQMPPLASARVDERGLALLREWVRGMK
jgi:uncharacterized repeat protein (TIGR03806 family)